MIKKKNKIITINGVDYISVDDAKKEQVKKQKEIQPEVIQCQQFEYTTREKLMKAIHKVFPAQVMTVMMSKSILENDIAVMDTANVAMLVAKTPQAKAILINFIDPDKTPEKIPELDYNTTDAPIFSYISTDYMLLGIQILELTGEKRIQLWCKKSIL